MMLMVQSKEGNVKVAAIGRTTEICADIASAIDYAIDSVEKEVHT